MVERVEIVLPQLQVAVISSYLGWISALILTLPIHVASPPDPVPGTIPN